MMINRHNYEEYFILYMDNELDSDQRRDVEAFVKNNPDLKEELDLLQQFKLVPDRSVVFVNKEELMSASIDAVIPVKSIDLSNYEEWLVLYMDNELDKAQQKDVEALIASEPIVKKEWELLQRTRLQPEEMVFADKTSLYRTEEKVRRIPARWFRVAAAVLLLLVAGTIAVIIFNDRKSTGGKNNEIVKSPTSVEQKIIPENPIIPVTENNAPVVQPLAVEKKPGINTPDQKQVKQEQQVIVNNKKEIKELTPNNPLPLKKEDPVIVENKNDRPSNNLPQPERNTNSIVTKDLSANVNPETLAPKNDLTNVNVTHASSSSLNTTGTDENSSGNKKGGLRSLLRKVTRTFEKRTNIDATDGEDRLLVAGLSLKLK